MREINKKIINNISGVRILEKVKDFNSIKFEAQLPAYESSNIRGVKPITDEIKVLVFDILSKDIHIFCKIKGGPIINLSKIKYSYDEFLIKLLN